MNWDDVVAKVRSYFREHSEDIVDYVETLNDYHSVEIPIPGNVDVFPMDEIDEILGNRNTLDIMKMALAGEDDDSYYNEGFNLDRKYFYITDGELHSTDNPDFDPEDYLDGEDFITSLYDYRDDLTLPKYIEKVFNAYDEEDSDVEEDEDEE